METSTVTVAARGRARHLKSSVPINSGSLSFAERKAELARASMPKLVEGDDLVNDIDTPLPGDTMMKPGRPRSTAELARQRSAYFEDAFSTKCKVNPARERVRAAATIVAEVKTNVIIADEFTIITELSSHLAVRYRRPLSSIVVVLQHGACMCFGGTFDPSYAMSISTIPSELQPTTNKRNAALIQKHMEEALGVLPSRGVLRFVPVAEENMAVNGMTVAGALDDLGKSGLDTAAAGHNLASRRFRGGKRLSVKSFGSLKETQQGDLTPPVSATENTHPVPPLPNISQETIKSIKEEASPPPEQEKKARRTKSFMATIFGRSSSKTERLSPVVP